MSKQIKKNKKRPFGLFLFLILLSGMQSKTYRSITVSNIEIEGNTKTKDFVIKREIRHPINILIDTLNINDDLNRLENLGIFSDVSWNLIYLDDSTAILKYNIQESIQQTPPTIFPTYNENKGWSLSTLWFRNNFRGRNQLLSLSGSIGAEDTYGISFNDPWLFDNHISLFSTISRNLYQHRFLGYDVDLNKLKFGFGKWFSDDIKTSISFSFERKEFSNESDVIKVFKYLNVNSIIKYDTRDIYWNPGKGVLFNHSFIYTEGNSINNLTWHQSYSMYFGIKRFKRKSVLAFNGSLEQIYGYENKFWQNYIGNSYTVRGWELPDNKIYKEEPYRFGHEFFHGSIEYRYEIIPKHITKYSIESGLAIVLFKDFGSMLYNLSLLNDKQILHGSGIGIRIPFPLIGVIRIDFGIGSYNGYSNSGIFHFGIGQKF